MRKRQPSLSSGYLPGRSAKKHQQLGGALWKLVTINLSLSVEFSEKNFQHLIDQVAVTGDFIKGDVKQLLLQPGIHSDWTANADQTCMERHVRVLSLGAGSIGGAAEIHAISCDKSPVAVEDETLQLPILRTRPPQPHHMKTLPIPFVHGHLDQIGT